MLRKIFGPFFGKITMHLGLLLGRTGVSPNALTLMGFLVVAGAAALIANGRLMAGGLTLLAGAFFDLLDGAVARHTGKASKQGAFLDSVLDRFSDGLLFGAIAWHFLTSPEDTLILILSFSALVLGFLVSYTKARAEGLDVECDVGIAERAERIVIPSLGLISGQLAIALGLLCVLSAVTVIQRFTHVWRQAKLI